VTKEVQRGESRPTVRGGAFGVSESGGRRGECRPLRLEELEPRIAPTVLAGSVLDYHTPEEVLELLDGFEQSVLPQGLAPVADVHVEAEGLVPTNNTLDGAETVTGALSSGTWFGLPAQRALIQGWLSTYDDIDLYSVEAEAGSEIIAFVTPSNSLLMPMTTILDPLGNPMQTAFSLSGESFYTVTQSGTYTVAISSFPDVFLDQNGESGGDYQIDLFVVPRPDGFQEAVLFLDFNGSPPVPGLTDFGEVAAFDLNTLDPTTNLPITGIYEFTGTRTEMIEQITDSVQHRFDLWGLPITAVNSLDFPDGPGGDYTTSVITDWPLFLGRNYWAGLLGIAGLPNGVFDHGNLDPNDGNLIFADEIARFTAGTPLGGEEVNAIAATIVHESGHNFGLRHTYHPVAIMSYLPDDTDPDLTYQLAPYRFFTISPTRGEELYGLQHAPELAYYGLINGSIFHETESSLAGGPPNDDLASAQWVPLDDLVGGIGIQDSINVLSSFQHDSPDTDVFAVPLLAGEPIDIKVFGPGFHGDSDGEEVAVPELLTFNDDAMLNVLGSPAELNSAITWTAKHSGVYYLAVSAFEDFTFDGASDAGLGLLSTGDYDLLIRMVSPSTGFGFVDETVDLGGDAADTPAGALGSLLTTANGTLRIAGSRTVGDVDYYAFELDAGDTVHIEADRADGGFDPLIGLFGPTGYIESTIDIYDASGSLVTTAGPDFVPEITGFAPGVSGLYYIAVTGDGGENGVPYNLRIQSADTSIAQEGVLWVTEALGTPNDLLLEFGDVGLGVSSTHSMVITNVGYGPLDITDIVSSAPADVSTDFAGTPVLLRRGESLTVEVTVGASPTGALAEMLTIESRNHDTLAALTDLDVGVTAEVFAGRLSVTEGTGISGDGVLDLGSVLNDGAGGRANTIAFLVSNLGPGDLDVNDVVLTTGTHFATDFAGAFVLEPGESRAIGVTFDPTVTGALGDILTIDTSERVVTLDLVGDAFGSETIGAGAGSNSFSYLEADGDRVEVSIQGSGAVADLGFNPGGDLLEFISLSGAGTGTELSVRVTSAGGDGMAVVGSVSVLNGQSLGVLTIEGHLGDLLVAGGLGRGNVTGMVTGDVFVQNGVGKFSTGGDLGGSSTFIVSGGVEDLAVGSRGSGADLNADVVIAGPLGKLLVDGGVSGSLLVQGNVDLVKTGEDFGASGVLEVWGDLGKLIVGSRRAGADLNADVYVGGDLTMATIFGEASGNLSVGGDLTRFRATDDVSAEHITILGNMDGVGDVDFFSFFAESGQVLTITTETAGGSGPPDTVIALFDDLDVMVAGPDNDGAGGTDSELSFAVPADGVYTLAVANWQDADFDGLDDVTTNPTDMPGHYIVTIDGVASSGIFLDAGFGHNDTLDDAQDISGGYGFYVGGSAQRIILGGRGSSAGLDDGLAVGVDLQRLLVTGDSDSDFWIGNDGRSLTFVGSVDGDMWIGHNLQRLAIGNRNETSDLTGTLWVGNDLKTGRVTGDVGIGFDSTEVYVGHDLKLLAVGDGDSVSHLWSDLAVGNDARRVTVTGDAPISIDIGGDFYRGQFGGDLGIFSVGMGLTELNVGKSLYRLRVGGPGIASDLWSEVNVAGSFMNLTVTGDVGDNINVGNDFGTGRVYGDFGVFNLTELNVVGNLNRLMIGERGDYGVLLSDINVEHDLGRLASGDIWSTVLVGENVRQVTTTSTVLQVDAPPPDFSFLNGADPTGSLIAGKATLRVKHV